LINIFTELVKMHFGTEYAVFGQIRLSLLRTSWNRVRNASTMTQARVWNRANKHTSQWWWLYLTEIFLSSTVILQLC